MAQKVLPIFRLFLELRSVRRARSLLGVGLPFGPGAQLCTEQGTVALYVNVIVWCVRESTQRVDCRTASLDCC